MKLRVSAVLVVAMAVLCWPAGSLAKEAQRPTGPTVPKYLTNALENPPGDSSLPNVLLLGDSISIGYTIPVREQLAGKANVFRPPCNCQYSSYGAAKVKSWLGKRKWDVIHFNWGIWDTHCLRGGVLVRGADEKKCPAGELKIRATETQYLENLERIVHELEATGAKLIWASTTPVMGPGDRQFEDIVLYNHAAAKLMRDRGIVVDDLHAYVLPYLAQWRTDDRCHYNALGCRMLGEKVAGSIDAALRERSKGSAGVAQVPVIYCTDLLHPHDDPDDHFDIACLFAMREVDIQAVILDQGAKQEQRPGRIPVVQLNSLTGRKVPWAIGLAERLRAPADKGLDQPERFQQGVRVILDVLRKARKPVTIITVGSMRDVAAAYNREPELFRAKVGRVFASIGDARGKGREYNVDVDPAAYSRMMGADVPLYWVPCFDGGIGRNEGNASYWQAKHRALLADAAEPVMNYFIYALLRKTEPDPVAWLHAKVSEEERAMVLAGERNLWSAEFFPYAVGRKYVVRDGRCLAVPADRVRVGDQVVEPFRFVPVAVRVDAQGREWLDGGPGSRMVNRFQIVDRQSYAEAMTSVVRRLIGEVMPR
jgi:hypothetical protein